MIASLTWPNPVLLTGRHVRLEPLTIQHHDDLVDSTQDGELWRLWYTSVPTPEGMATEIERRCQLHGEGKMLPFAVVSTEPGPLHNRAVGMTSYMNVDAPNRRLEIGSTWYRQSVQRSAINTESKYLLLAHAFDTLDSIAVEFRTHSHNRCSRQAIERLGARLDGILRQHQINQHPGAAHTLRDTCVYSIIRSEWPTVRVHLQYRLGAS